MICYLTVKVANANVDTGTSVIFLHLLSLINPDFSLHHMLRTISAEFLLPLEGFFHDPTIFQNQIDVISHQYPRVTPCSVFRDPAYSIQEMLPDTELYR